MEPDDMLHLSGSDPLNDAQIGARYYTATGDSGQGIVPGFLQCPAMWFLHDPFQC